MVIQVLNEALDKLILTARLITKLRNTLVHSTSENFPLAPTGVREQGVDLSATKHFRALRTEKPSTIMQQFHETVKCIFLLEKC